MKSSGFALTVFIASGHRGRLPGQLWRFGESVYEPLRCDSNQLAKDSTKGVDQHASAIAKEMRND